MAEEIIPKELKITLYTNIPTDIDYEKDVLTFGSLSSEELKEVKIKPTAYPYFTYQVKYDESIIRSLSYADVVKTFFDKEEFMNKFGYSNEIIQISDTSERRTDNINNNIMLTLQYLLPTKWPVINNHFNSYDLFKGKDSMNTLFFNPFSSKYVYLKLSSGTYTMKKIVWLNDFLNHPDYKKGLEDAEIKVIGKSSNEELQKIMDMNDNVKDNDKGEKIKKIKGCYLTNCDSETNKCIYTGIQIDTDPYEIVVDVELFENEIKDGEESKIKCSYYSDHLGEELLRLVKKSKRRPNKKEYKGLIVKMPLFSTTNMTSRKRGDIDKEELDEEKREKRKREDQEYNDIERDIRKNYEDIVNIFFENMNKSALKNRIKKFDINKKNFYTFLEENIESLLRFVTLSEIDKRVEKYKQILKESKPNKKIAARMDDYTYEKNRKRISKEDFDKLKIQYDLAKELLEFIIKKYSIELIKGGTKKKRSNKIKNTRKLR
jgi:hypothetical protein